MCIRFVVLDINTLQETKQLLMAITNTLKVHYHFQIKIIDKVFTCNMIARFRYYFEWAFFAFLTFRSRFLNPKTLLHLYNTVALSPALLGCENCKYIHVSSFDLQTFISFQHFVCMDVLKLPELCRSYIGESIIFFLPIDAEIYARHLLFFVRLCHLSYEKKISLTRLYSFIYK